MQREIRTKLSVYPDYPTSVATRENGSHINCVAFNLDYISRADYAMFVRIWELFNKAKKLRSK